MGIWKIYHELRALVLRRRVETDIDDELQFHVDMQAQKYVEEGMTRPEAERRARVEFGGLERYKDAVRDTQKVRLLDDLRQDLRIGWRALRATPGFTAVVVLTLALGMGANTAVFSVVHGVLLRALPYADAHRIMMVWENDRVSGTEREAASVPDYNDFIARSRSFAGLAGFYTQQLNLSAAGSDAERVDAALVSHTLAPVLGITPLRGRWMTAAEDQPNGERVALLSARLWRTRFASADVLGQVLRLDDRAYTIVGILPEEVDFPDAEVDLWVPLQMDPATLPRSMHSLSVIGRLAPGVTAVAAQAEMTRIASQLEAEYPENAGRGVTIEPLEEVMFGRIRPALMVLLGAVGLVLLIACANIGNLLLARAASRRREVAVRGALGAGRGRLARQFFAESLLLVMLSAAAGVLAARFGLQALLALAPADLPRIDGVGIDAPVLLFSGGIGLLVAFGFGLVPLFDARRQDLQRVLTAQGSRANSASAGQMRFRAGLVTVEVALSVLLLLGAGLLMRSFWLLQRVDPGFESENVLTASYRLPTSRYPQNYGVYPNWPEIQRFQQESLARARALPGVREAALAALHPMEPGFTNSIVIEGREAEAANQPEMPMRPVGASYFRTVGVPLLRGRLLSDDDRADTPPVVVINEAAARRFFPGTDPVGKRIRFWGPTWREIVGVVGNEKFYGLGEESPPAMYPVLTQVPFGSGTLLVRASGDPLALARELRTTIGQFDRELALFNVAPLRDAISGSIARERFTMLLLAVFAGVALLLVLVGIHGVLSYTVAQRAREVGIRAALGAQPAELLRLVVGQGMRPVLLGAGIGVLGALIASRALESLLYGIGRNDPLTFAAVLVSVLGAGAFACWLPARRALLVSPAATLRAD